MAKIDGRTIDHKALEHIRILAVRRVIEEGEAPSDVIKSFGLVPLDVNKMTYYCCRLSCRLRRYSRSNEREYAAH
jgi:hypothetical protein